MISDLDTLSWPASKLNDAVEALARTLGLSPRPVEMLRPPEDLGRDGGEPLGRWIEAAVGGFGLEAEPAQAPYAEIERLLRGAGPALLRLPVKGEPHFLAVLGSRRRTISLLGPNLTKHQLRVDVVRAALCRDLEAPLAAGVNRLLDQAGVPERHRPRAAAAILRASLNQAWVGGSWLLRLSPGASFWRQLRQARLPRRLLVLVGAHAIQYLLWLLSWWMVGQGALQGRLDAGWLLAWALLLLTLVPFRLLATWTQGLLAIGAGGLLKQRLLYGALRLEPEEIRLHGAGQLLGRVIESEAVESLALSGGFAGLVAGIELVLAAVVLSLGAGGKLHALLLLCWVGLIALTGVQYFRHRRRWTDERLGMTNDLVERMVGHRTRLAQETPERWHDGEDQALDSYLERSRAMDWRAALLMALVPSGWLVLGLLGLAPAFVSGHGSRAALAISLGGILLAYQALRRLAMGLSDLAGAAIAWTQAAPLFHAAARPEVRGSPALASAFGPGVDDPRDERPLLMANDLVFRYGDRGEPVLRGVSLQVFAGDRLLLEGPSGSGKSTLAALLIGLRRPESGLLLLNGLDRQTLGAQGWRRRVVAAPQFHENHVLTGTFAFNLLMGRHWPPAPAEIEEAEALCRELGLGDLLERMPAELLQMVGESGWQLSHGERSRLYIARALLQGAELIILDENFAALDPETFRRALSCVLTRASTLLVIAHP